ncbi:MAG TPA: glycosyltransferase, partial [Oceanospirillales bacterium]|nr:glycosyltransferase [Oceanospirillales bacterium]
IAATCISHVEYKTILESIIQQFNISSVIVSSLIGHSLDCLQTGLPTIRVLHDYFPSWPSLIADLDKPEISEQDLDLALEQTKNEPFGQISKQQFKQWQQKLHQLYQAKTIKLIAPSESVVKNLQKIDKDSFKQLTIIPHAIAKIPFIDFIRKSKTFKILILGRINPPKGQELLEQIMHKLGKAVQFVLLGAGNEGKKYLPEKNITVIMDYANDELAQHLQKIQANIALITSQTSETFNYTLSELQQAGICTLSTKYGALENRIIDGKTGFLCEDNADDFIQKIKQLQTQPELINAIRQNLKAETPYTFADEIKSYKKILSNKTSSYKLFQQVKNDKSFAQNLLLTDIEKHRIENLLVETEEELQERTKWARKLTENLKQASENIDLERKESQHLKQVIQKEKKRFSQEIAAIQKTLKVETTRMQQEIKQTQLAFNHAQQQFEQTLLKLQETEQNLFDTQADKERIWQELTSVYQSRSWRVTKPLRKFTSWARHKRNALKFRMTQLKSFPSRAIRSLKTRGFIGTLGVIKNKFSSKQTPPQNTQEAPKNIELEQNFDKISLTLVENPVVSIIIPVYNHFEHTYNCLKSIAKLNEKTSFEVIVVDDCSTDETPELIKNISGITYHRQQQ